MEAAAMGRALRLSITEGALACAMGSLTGGVFLTGFALALGADSFQIGLIAAMATLGNVAQLGGSYLVERSGHSKRVCMRSLWAARLLWLAVPLAPLVAGRIHPGASVWCLLGLLAGSQVLNAMGGVAWLAWIKDLVPERVRIGFLSRRNQVDTVVALSLSIAGGALIDWWNQRQPGSTIGFLCVFGIAMLCGLVGLPLMAQIPEARPHQPQRQPFAVLVGSTIADSSFRRVLGFYTFWNLAVNVSAPFFVVYMLQQLKLPFWYVTLLLTIGSIAGLVANPFWSRLSEKFGHRPVIFLATLGDAFFPLWWLFIGPGATWALLPIHLSGVFNAPLAVGPTNMLLKLSEKRSASPYMALFNTVVGPVTALAAAGGGYLVDAWSGSSWSVGPFEFGGLQLVFLISFVGRLFSLSLLYGYCEPSAKPIGRVVGVLNRLAVSRPASLMPAFSLRWQPRLPRPVILSIEPRPAETAPAAAAVMIPLAVPLESATAA